MDENDGLTVEPEAFEEFDPEIQKMMAPEVMAAMKEAMGKLRGVMDKLPPNLKSAVARLQAAAAGKEKEGYPPPTPQPENLQKVEKKMTENTEVLASLQRIEKRLTTVESEIGVAPDQMISLRDAEKVAAELWAEMGAGKESE